MKRFPIYILLLISLANAPFFTQAKESDLPRFFIQNYSKQHYNASCQNWSCTLSSNGTLYIGNNSGLLVFDGNNWHQYPLPEGSGIINALTSYQDTLFSGSLNDFGYWYAENGTMQYRSLIKNNRSLTFKNETFGLLYNQDNDLWIKSEHHLLRYANGCLSEMAMPQNSRPARLDNSFIFSQDSGYYRTAPNGILKMEMPLFPEQTAFISPLGNQKYLLGSIDRGLFLANKEGCSPWEIPINKELKKNRITAYARIGSVHCIGTASSGLYLIDVEGNLLHHFHIDNRLQDNCIHDIGIQNQTKIWLTLDNGISSVDLQSPVMLLAPRTKYGKLLDAALLDNQLWIETNLGIFRYEQGQFEKVPESERSEWRERENPPTSLPTAIADTLVPIRKIISENNEITWLLKEDNQVVRIRISPTGKAESVRSYGTNDGITAPRVTDIAIIDDIPTLATGSELLRYEKGTDQFYPDTRLGTNEDLKQATLFFPAKDNQYWISKDNEAFLYTIKDRQSLLMARVNFTNYDLNLVNREKRIITLSDSLHLVSTMEGIVVVNAHALIKQNVGMDTTFSVKRISYTENEHEWILSDNDKIILPHRFKQLDIEVGTSLFTTAHPVSYQLLPVTEEWSPWQKEGRISFWQLPPGKYQLNIRKYTVRGPFTVITLPVIVRPAWYSSTIALTGWALLIGIIVYIGIRIRFNKKEQILLSQKENELLAEQHEKERLKNEILENELKNKNNELTLQTTAIIRRNKVMQQLLLELEGQKEKLGDRYPNKMYLSLHGLIEKNLSNPADWVLFESYFNTAHQNFTERLRAKHPELTANDLQLCCLLRMNLSSKEIASLQNVSVRAVELRRYRLRKRLQLENEENLNDFLMTYSI